MATAIKGRRRPDGGIDGLDAGDYYRTESGDWFGKTPTGRIVLLSGDITEHADLTITVQDRIVTHATRDGKGRIHPGWRGSLARGFWQEVHS